MTAEVVVAVGISWLILAGGTVIPLLEAVVTKELAPAWVRGLVLAVLSGVAGVVATAIADHGSIPLEQAAYTVVSTALVAMAAHYGLTASGVLGPIRKATAGVGLGSVPAPAPGTPPANAAEKVIMLVGWGRLVGPADAVRAIRVIRDERPPGAPRRTWGRSYRRWERTQLAVLVAASQRQAPEPLHVPPADASAKV